MAASMQQYDGESQKILIESQNWSKLQTEKKVTNRKREQES